MSKNKAILIVAILSLFINLLPISRLSAQTEIKTPTIIDIILTGDQPTRPIIKGLTPRQTEVLVYIDGSFIGLAKIDSQGTDSDSFSLQSPNALRSGRHAIMAVARDKTSLRLSPPTPEKTIIIQSISAPTLVAPNEQTITGKVKPLITGLTKSGSFVHIYIDGKYNGKTAVVEHKSGTANFAYKPFLNLSVGSHTVAAVAEDKLGLSSPMTPAVTFRILPPTPAPSRVKVSANYKQTAKPIISGLVKNGSTVKVFIDKQLYGTFQAKDNRSGTANFAYIPYVGLTNGRHFVYTVAYDSIGKESTWSNIVYFNVGTVAEPKITPVAVTEKPSITVTPMPAEEPAKSEIKETAEPTETEAPAKSEEAVPPAITDEDLKAILESATGTVADTGIINESKKSQSKPQTNLIIFILFLVAVIAWIFWVNRELIREKREQEQSEKKD